MRGGGGQWWAVAEEQGSLLSLVLILTACRGNRGGGPMTSQHLVTKAGTSAAPVTPFLLQVSDGSRPNDQKARSNEGVPSVQSSACGHYPARPVGFSPSGHTCPSHFRRCARPIPPTLDKTTRVELWVPSFVQWQQLISGRV